MKHDHSRSERGYVLMMTLFLLSISATAMIGLAIESHRRARQALMAQESLQTRWGSITCQQAFLPRCADVLKSVSDRQDKPASRIAFSCRLGTQRFVVVLGDEQAKLNVNRIAAICDRQETEDRIKRLVLDPSLVQLHPSQRTETGKDAKLVIRDEFAAFGQIFADVPPGALMGNELAAGLADHITAWGDGTLHAHAATPEVLLAFCSLELNSDQMTRLKETLAQSPSRPPEELFATIGISNEKRKALQRLFVEKSACHSVWIGGNVDVRPAYRFAVRSEGKRTETAQFVW